MSRRDSLISRSAAIGLSVLCAFALLFGLSLVSFPPASGEGARVNWPPHLGQEFPDLQLIDQTGREFRLSELIGKVILVEPIAMNCPACNAFSGAQEKGGYKGLRPQQGLQSIEKYLPKYAKGVDIRNPDLKLVQLLLYDFNMNQPNAEDARFWAEHFGLDNDENVLVVVSKTDLRGKESFRMIPGFQLVDRQFILRKDATGHRPRHNLFTDLLPAIADLIQG